jgi:DDE family transposase
VIDIADIRRRYRMALPFLDERGRRLFAANEAMALGHGGVQAASTATGVARSTIGRGLKELSSGRNEIGAYTRRPGAGRKRATELMPQLLPTLQKVIDGAIRGDPEAPLRWVSRSQRNIAAELQRRGFEVSQKLVGQLVKQLGYSMRANAKTREGTHHPDRDAQFQYINAQVSAALAAGEPAISVDTKKKELVGDFKNGGRELRRRYDPEPVAVHDFEIPENGKVAPYGVYDIANNEGWVNVGIGPDTAAFAVESIRRWWFGLGGKRFLKARRLLITADAGGSNGVRLRLWKLELQRFADETGLAITVTHHPPGTSKWNRIEHQLFSFISQNWRAKPLVSYQVIISLIAATKTDTGLVVRASLDDHPYEKGVKVSDEQMRTINLSPHAFHGDWNYTISPCKTRNDSS